MTKIVPTKIEFKGGGFIVVETQEDLEAQSSVEDLKSITIASAGEVKDFKAHQNFMRTGQKYIDLIEDHVEGRPGIEERFRYDANDILNLMSFLLNKKEPVKKKTQKTLSKEDFKEALERKPFEVINGGADATK